MTIPLILTVAVVSFALGTAAGWVLNDNEDERCPRCGQLRE